MSQTKEYLRAKKTYLKGKSIFIVSLFVVVVTFLVVNITGDNYGRDISADFFISLVIIATALFIFMTYGLYKGIGLIDDFPKYKNFEPKSAIAKSGAVPELPAIDLGSGIGGLLLSILLWVLMSILFVVLMILLEVIFWISLFIILAMLYWVFFRALKVVFTKCEETRDNLGISAVYAMGYTLLYTGWIFGIIYLVQVINKVNI